MRTRSESVLRRCGLVASLLLLCSNVCLAATPTSTDPSVEVTVEFSAADRVGTRVSESELGGLTGQKLPYVVGTWIRAALHKLDLPFVERPIAPGSSSKEIVSIRGVGEGSSP